MGKRGRMWGWEGENGKRQMEMKDLLTINLLRMVVVRPLLPSLFFSLVVICSNGYE